MNIAEKVFLGSLIKAEYLLKDTVIQPIQLESTRHQEMMRRMVDRKRAGKKIDLISLTTLPDLESFGGMSYLTELQSYADVEKFDELITSRLIASIGGFNRAKMRDPKRMLTESQKNKWSDVIGNLDETHIQIFDGAVQM